MVSLILKEMQTEIILSLVLQTKILTKIIISLDEKEFELYNINTYCY